MSEERTTGKGGSPPGDSVAQGNASRGGGLDGAYQAQFEGQLEEALDAEARREASDMPVGERLDADDFSEGDVVVFSQVDGGDEFRAEVQEIEYDLDGNVDELLVQGEETHHPVFPTDDGLMTANVAYEVFDSERREIPDVGIDTASYEEVRGALDEWVERGGTSNVTWSEDGAHPISDAAADEALDTIAESLSSAKYDDLAERVTGALSHVGDDVSRAFANVDIHSFEAPRTGMVLEESSFGSLPFASRVAEDTVTHETGHVVLNSYGLSGTDNRLSQDWNGDVPSYDWGYSGQMAPQERYAIDVTEGPTTSYSAEAAYGRDQWEPKVDQQIASATGPDESAFATPPSGSGERSQWWTETVDEGGYLRFDNPVAASSGGDAHRVWRVEDKSTSSLTGSIEYELSSGSGESMTITVDGGRGPFSGSGDITSTSAASGVSSVPGYADSGGEWHIETTDPDAALGGEAPESDEAAMAQLAERANEAWYRQAVLKREYNSDVAADATIGATYSATNAHETVAKLHETMQSPGAASSGLGASSVNTSQVADSLVNYHPELLEAYRQTFEISPSMKQELNDALEESGASFRFDT